MRGASAQARVDLREQLEAGLGSADAATVGADLFHIATVLRAEAGLRRVATDASTDAEAKAGLVGGLFEGKVAPLSLELLREAARRRWSATRDLPDTLEYLSEVATVRSAGDAGARRVVDELFTVAQVVGGSPELRDALSDRTRSMDDRTALVESLLGDKALPATVSLAKQALSGSHRTVQVALAEYQKIAAAVQDEHIAKVRVARDLSDSDRERLQRALSAQYDRAIHLNVVVEPGLLGGIRVEIGDDVIDGTVVARLDEARRKLAG